MARLLGIPARVAVGFTSGQLEGGRAGRSPITTRTPGSRSGSRATAGSRSTRPRPRDVLDAVLVRLELERDGRCAAARALRHGRRRIASPAISKGSASDANRVFRRRRSSLHPGDRRRARGARGRRDRRRQVAPATARLPDGRSASCRGGHPGGARVLPPGPGRRGAAERDARRPAGRLSGTSSDSTRARTSRPRGARGSATRRTRRTRRGQRAPSWRRCCVAVRERALSARPPARVRLAAVAARVAGMTETYDLFQQGRAHLRSGRPAQATVALEKAKRREPRSRSIREALAIAYFRLGRFEEAEAEFRTLVDLAPADDFAHYGLARSLRQPRAPQRSAAAHQARALAPAADSTSARARSREAS